MFSATIPVDVVGRSTVQVDDDFLLVGASDNGESAPMLKWDSRNSEWIELEVRKQGKLGRNLTKYVFLQTKSRKAFGAPVVFSGQCRPLDIDPCDHECCGPVVPFSCSMVALNNVQAKVLKVD